MLKVAFRAYQKLSKIHPFGPLQVRIETTKVCNLKCIGCRRTLVGNIAGQPGEKHLTLDLLEGIVSNIPVKLVKFGGDGEPFVNPHLFKILEYLRDNSIKSTFTTNGTLLTEDVVRKLKECGVIRIGVSFTGATRDTFEMMRVGARFDRVVESCFLLSKYKVPFYVNYLLLTKQVIEEVPEAVQLARKVGATGILFMKPYPVESEDVLSWVDLSWVRDNRMDCIGSLNVLPTYADCQDPFVCPFVTLSGDVFPCQYMANQRVKEYYLGESIDLPVGNYMMGNTGRQSLRDIWKGDSYRQLRLYLKDTAKSTGKVITREELLTIRHSGSGQFGYCVGCLYRWREAGG